MPRAIIAITRQMKPEFLGNLFREWDVFYGSMKSKFARAGYDIPEVIIWSVKSRENMIYVDDKREGVLCALGHSVAVCSQIMRRFGFAPVRAMERVIGSERYECVRISGKSNLHKKFSRKNDQKIEIEIKGMEQ